MGLIVWPSRQDYQPRSIQSDAWLLTPFNREPVLLSKKEMRFAGNEPPLRSGSWPRSDAIDLAENP